MLTMLLTFVLASPGLGSAATQGRTVRVKVVNATGRRIQAIHVSPSSRSDWGENLLGSAQDGEAALRLRADGLAATLRTEVAVPGECGLYDVRLVADRGAEFLLDEVELCEDGDVFTITDRELTHVRIRDLGTPR